ncbi:protein lin-9 homolog [Bradysia coprophila]|uniref:protein lin-9 homolog n=1 Tax=Bradysia coprophila TaxID=38358 RepID=UPI00187D90DB|nr:protein lin-9 homolog [Bradysia coprophila]XP_037027351.1 protein lin-9 homolog [Bradysia coprophila]XP_037027352.1 protein lin-9 homolog [Bradysia coprophila]
MPKKNSNIKEESEEDIDDETSNNEPVPFAAALGLRRVGSAPPKKPQQQPLQALNARGMPARIRKKNKLFFDDDVVIDKPQASPIKRPARTEPVKSPTKSAKKRRMTPSRAAKVKEDTKDSDDEPAEKRKTTVLTFDRVGSQRIGLRLRNILKLPKAHKWVGYEFFYSYLDRPLFESENDFQICLHDFFPALTNRQLTRIEWNKVRRLMGKPRRSSQAFFDEERHELERRRQKIRLLQTRKSADLEFVRDLPNEIPLPLPIGTKVTARLRHPQDGMFTGSIDAFDSMSSIYRITFDRAGLGTHSVPDFEVAANEFIESIPLNTFTKNPRIRNTSLLNRKLGLLSGSKNDPLLGSEIYNNSKSIMMSKESIGGFQLKLLEMVIRTKKTIAAKQMKLVHLKSMNAEAEMLKSAGDIIPDDFQRRYASMLIGMEKLNGDLAKYLSQIQTLSRDLTKEPLIAALLTPSYLREQCKSLAEDTVEKNNQAVKDESMLRLITDLATIMWVASNLSSDEGSSSARTVLDVCLEEAKSRLDPENIVSFQKNVQVHLRHLDNDLQSNAN